jgi:hypothetical protein
MSDVISGDQHKKLREALKNAFPNNNSLSLMIREELELSPQEFVKTGEGLNQHITDLIEECISTGRLLDLLAGARLRVPKNPVLCRCTEDLIYSREFAVYFKNNLLEVYTLELLHLILKAEFDLSVVIDLCHQSMKSVSLKPDENGNLWYVLKKLVKARIHGQDGTQYAVMEFLEVFTQNFCLLDRKLVNLSEKIIKLIKNNDLPSGWTKLTLDQQLIFELSAYLRCFQATFMKEFLIMYDDLKFRHFREKDFYGIFNELKQMEYWEYAGNGKYKLKAEFRNYFIRQPIQIEPVMNKRVHEAALQVYKNLLSRPVDDRSSLILDELYNQASIQKITGQNFDCCGILDGRLKEYNPEIDLSPVLLNIKDEIQNNSDDFSQILDDASKDKIFELLDEWIA